MLYDLPVARGDEAVSYTHLDVYKRQVYPYARFQGDWSPTSPDNEYGPIKNHKIAEAAHYGNGVLIAVLINGRKTDALNLAYDPKSGSLSFAPPGVTLYLGP